MAWICGNYPRCCCCFSSSANKSGSFFCRFRNTKRVEDTDRYGGRYAINLIKIQTFIGDFSKQSGILAADVTL